MAKNAYIIPFEATITQVIAKHGYSNLPLWDTEAACGNQITDQDGSSACVARRYILEASLGIDRFIWYAWWLNGGQYFQPLWTPNQGLLPAGQAYVTMSQWLVGATVQKCTPRNTIWACLISRDNGYQGEVLWTTGASVNYSVPATYKQFRDVITNRPQSIRGQAVVLGNKPILIEN